MLRPRHRHHRRRHPAPFRSAATGLIGRPERHARRPAKPSANPGQSVSSGSGLSTATRYRRHVHRRQRHPADGAAEPVLRQRRGTRGEFAVPAYLNGAATIRVVGSHARPGAADRPRPSPPTSTPTDTATSTAPASSRAPPPTPTPEAPSPTRAPPPAPSTSTSLRQRRRRPHGLVPAFGPAPLAVTTAGGTSAPFAAADGLPRHRLARRRRPSTPPAGLGRHRHPLKQVDPATGAVLASYPPPGGSSTATAASRSCPRR